MGFYGCSPCPERAQWRSTVGVSRAEWTGDAAGQRTTDARRPRDSSGGGAVSGVSGHVALVERKKGASFYVKYRLADGRQVQRRLGPAWTGPGEPPRGYYTRRLAEAALRELLADAQRGRLPGQTRT